MFRFRFDLKKASKLAGAGLLVGLAVAVVSYSYRKHTKTKEKNTVRFPINNVDNLPQLSDDSGSDSE